MVYCVHGQKLVGNYEDCGIFQSVRIDGCDYSNVDICDMVSRINNLDKGVALDKIRVLREYAREQVSFSGPLRVSFEFGSVLPKVSIRKSIENTIQFFDDVLESLAE